MKRILLVVAALLLTALWVVGVEPVPTEVTPQKIESATPRNVIFILSDDHRYDAMSFFDAKRYRTTDQRVCDKSHETKRLYSTT